MAKVYVDMDGVLAEWQWVGLDKLTEKGYFSSLEPMVNVVECIKELIREGKEVFILSSVLPNGHAQHDKHLWISRNIPEIDPKHRIFVPYGQCKSDYVQPGEKDILIDDYNPNLLDWIGIPVKLMNGVNGGSGEWKGRTLDYRSEPDILALTINAWQK